MKIIKFCWNYIWRYKCYFIINIIINMILAGIAVTLPYLSGVFIDKLVEESSFYFLFRFCIGFIILSILNLILGYWVNIYYTKLLLDSTYSLTCHIIEQTHSTTLNKIKKIDPVYMNHRISQDSGSIISFTVSTISGLLTNIFNMAAAAIIMFFVSIKLTLILFGFVFFYIIIYKLFQKPLYAFGRVLKEHQNVYFSKMAEQLSQAKFVKVHSVADVFKIRLDETFHSFRKAFMRYQYISSLFSSLDGMISTSAQAFLFVIGGLEVISGSLTVGMFVVFSSFFARFISSASGFLKIGGAYRETLISYDRIQEILSWGIEKNGEMYLEEINEIKLINLKVIIDNKQLTAPISYTFTQGHIYGIIGDNGIGKSTLFLYILGLLDKENNNVYYNGSPVNIYNLSSIRKDKIAVIEQEPNLMNDNIYYNLHIGNSIRKVDTLMEIFSEIGLKTFIENLDLGLNTIIDSQNNNISGGEKQKIALMRLFIKDSSVLLMDEPSSALDKDAVTALLSYLQNLKERKIIIIITHDTRVLNICDNILNLSEYAFVDSTN